SSSCSSIPRPPRSPRFPYTTLFRSRPVELFRQEDRAGIKRRFDAVHETRYGYSAPTEQAEIVSLRGAVTGLLRKPGFESIAAGTAEPPAASFRGARPVYFAEARRHLHTPTYDRARLTAANHIAGPPPTH